MSGQLRQAVSTPNAPQAIGPYSQAIKANGLVFISGQVAFDPATGNLITGGIEQQTEQVMKNLSAILEASGSAWEKVVKTTVYLKIMSEFAQKKASLAEAFLILLERRLLALTML